jgi:histidine ammonia-lyase
VSVAGCSGAGSSVAGCSGAGLAVSEPVTIVLATAADIDRDVVVRVAADRARLRLGDPVLEHLEVTRRACLDALATGAGAGVYGVTTGMGFKSDVPLDPAEQRDHQASLLLGRAVGGPPYLDVEDARAIVVARLTNLLSGHAGVSASLCHWLVAWLNDGYAPAVPAGGVGTAGEVQPLAHAFQALLGVGRVLSPEGTVLPAEDALRERHVAPYLPGPKEGIALLAGAPAAAGMGAVAHARVARLARSLEVVAAASLEAADAPPGPYTAAAGRLSGDPLLVQHLARLRRWRDPGAEPSGEGAARSGAGSGALGAGAGARSAAGSGAGSGAPGVGSAATQAPVSIRVTPVVATHLARCLDRFAEDVDRGLGAVTDSPAFVDGGFLATAGFHALDLAAGLDTVRAALVRSTELAAQRIHRLLDPRVTGLPAQLATGTGGAGMIVVHKRAVAAVAEARRLAAPVSVGLQDTSLGQEDAQTFTFEAFAALRRVEALAAEVAGCELACALQAVWLRGRDLPAPLAEALAPARVATEPLVADRPLGDDLDRLAALVAEGLAVR